MDAQCGGKMDGVGERENESKSHHNYPSPGDSAFIKINKRHQHNAAVGSWKCTCVLFSVGRGHSDDYQSFMMIDTGPVRALMRCQRCANKRIKKTKTG